MGEELNNTQVADGTQKPDDAPSTPPGENTDAGKNAVKTVPLSDLIEVRKRAQTAEKRLGELEAAEKARADSELTESQRLAKENEELKSTVSTLAQKEAKRDALSKALEKIGDGFTLGDKYANVSKAVEKLQYNADTVTDDIQTIVDLAKQPKTTSKSPIINSTAGGGGDRTDPLKMTGADLTKLQREDPDEFKRVIEARRDAKSKWPSINKGAAAKTR